MEVQSGEGAVGAHVVGIHTRGTVIAHAWRYNSVEVQCGGGTVWWRYSTAGAGGDTVRWRYSPAGAGGGTTRWRYSPVKVQSGGGSVGAHVVDTHKQAGQGSHTCGGTTRWKYRLMEVQSGGGESLC